MLDHDQARALQAAKEAVEQGFRAFIAARGHYGIVATQDGSRVVSFQAERLTDAVSVGGNYRTSNPLKTGTGWVIGDYAGNWEHFLQNPPTLPRDIKWWRYETLAQHLDRYGPSSKYVEVLP